MLFLHNIIVYDEHQLSVFWKADAQRLQKFAPRNFNIIPKLIYFSAEIQEIYRKFIISNRNVQLLLFLPNNYDLFNLAIRFFFTKMFKCLYLF